MTRLLLDAKSQVLFVQHEASVYGYDAATGEAGGLLITRTRTRPTMTLLLLLCASV